MTDVLVLGCDGYLGWPIFHDLRQHGYSVHGVDHFGAREYRGESVVPIDSPEERFGAFSFAPVDITNYTALEATLRHTEPETVLNLAQIPSAPYSMASRENAWTTQRNNILGALNLYWAIHELGLDTHVIQLATMGEYGAPEAGIPEGFLDDGRPAPKDPPSYYHASKVNATVNTYFAAKTWGIPTTEIMQGIVYGVPEGIRTRFDVDAVWGTVLNRFTAQAAVGHPLTVYGRGGQKRAMLPIDDVLQCVRLLVENPPEQAYRAVNQFHRAYRVRELAELVAGRTGADIEHVENPRVEDDSDHDYDPERRVLDDLGYEPADDLAGVFERTYAVVAECAERVDEREIVPDVTWR